MKIESAQQSKEISKYKDLVSSAIHQLTVINLIDSQSLLHQERHFQAHIKTIGNTYSFDYENSTLSELSNSGELKKISVMIVCVNT
jgi:hypothetical protein